MNSVIKKLEDNNINVYYYSLLNQLSKCSEDYNEEKLKKSFKKLSENNFIYILEVNYKIVGTISIIIEQKLLRNGSKVGHIEDFVIDKHYGSKEYGSELLNFAVKFCQDNSCYKCILNCSEEMEKFYKRFNFENKNVEMSLYF